MADHNLLYRFGRKIEYDETVGCIEERTAKAVKYATEHPVPGIEVELDEELAELAANFTEDAAETYALVDQHFASLLGKMCSYMTLEGVIKQAPLSTKIIDEYMENILGQDPRPDPSAAKAPKAQRQRSTEELVPELEMSVANIRHCYDDNKKAWLFCFNSMQLAKNFQSLMKEYLEAIDNPTITSKTSITRESASYVRVDLSDKQYETFKVNYRRIKHKTHVILDTYFIKNLRGDTGSIACSFIDGITRVPGESHISVRAAQYQPYTIAEDTTSKVLTVQKRSEKQPQYPKKTKETFSKSHAVTLVTPECIPQTLFKLGGIDNTNKQVAFMFAEKDVLVNRAFTRVVGSVRRPYDHATKAAAQTQYDIQVASVNRIMYGPHEMPAFKEAIKGKITAQEINEGLARLRFNLDGSSKIVISNDNHEARFLAYGYAVYLAKRLEHRSQQLGSPINILPHQIPICFYAPGTENHLRCHNVFEQAYDRYIAYQHYDNRTTHYTKKNYEFLLMLDNGLLLEALRENLSGFPIFVYILHAGYIELANLLFHKLNQDKTFLGNIIEELKAKKFNFQTILQHLARVGKLSLLTIFIDHDTLIPAAMQSIITAAAQMNHWHIIRYIITKYPHIHYRECYGIALLYAAAMNKTDVAIELAHAGASLNQKFIETGAVPLHFAVSSNNANLFIALLANGADVTVTNNAGSPSLAILDEESSEKFIKELVEYYKTAPKRIQELFKVLLYQLVRYTKELNLIILFLEAGITTIADFDNIQGGLLHYAAYYNRCDLLEHLAVAGDDFSATTQETNGKTACTLAAERGNWDTVTLIATLKPGETQAQKEEYSALLLMAAAANQTDAAMALIDSGATTTGQFTASGKTAAHCAAEHNNARLLKALVDTDADLGAKTTQETGSKTPLDLAIEGKYWPCIKIIAEHKHPELKETYGDALVHASKAKETDVAIALIQAGASFTRCNIKTRETAAHYAVKHNDTELLQALADAGANLMTKTNEKTGNKTQLGLALESGYWDCFRIIATHNYFIKRKKRITAKELDHLITVIQSIGTALSPSALTEEAVVHWVVAHDQAESLQKLLSIGVNLTACIGISDYETLLDLVVTQGSWHCLRQIIPYRDMRPTEKESYGRALLYACQADQTKVALELIEKNSALDCRIQGMMAIHHAAGHGNSKLLSAFLDRNPALLTEYNAEGKRPLIIAAAQHHWGCVLQIIKLPNLPEACKQDYAILLFYAISNNNTEALLEVMRIFELNKECHGYPEQANNEMMRVLMRTAPQLLRVTHNNFQTLLNIIAFRSDWRAAMTILDYLPADCPKDQYGILLLLAIIHNQENLALKLINNGVSNHCVPLAGWFFQATAEQGNCKIFAKLITTTTKSYLSQKNSAGKTAIILAAEKNHWEYVRTVILHYSACSPDH